jgi:hypothetical protein
MSEKRWRNETWVEWQAVGWLGERSQALKENLIEHLSAIYEKHKDGGKKDEEWYLIKKENEDVDTFFEKLPKSESSRSNKIAGKIFTRVFNPFSNKHPANIRFLLF